MQVPPAIAPFASVVSSNSALQSASISLRQATLLPTIVRPTIVGIVSTEPDSTMSELATSQELRLVIEAIDYPSSGTTADSYQIRQIDKANNTILSLIVPSTKLVSAVLGRVELFIALSPSGEISITSDDTTSASSLWATIKIEQLIKQSIAPQMLEDEPNAAAMLQALKRRLIASLTTVDEAISNLDSKPSP